jgi:HAT1-interacting factor 1
VSGADGEGPILSFSGDAEEDDVPEGEETTVDLFAQAEAAEAAEDDAEREEDEEAEPEDDFNAAWEVLDLARAIYEKQTEQEEDDEVKLKLADTYIALGDVSLETGEFPERLLEF